MKIMTVIISCFLLMTEDVSALISNTTLFIAVITTDNIDPKTHQVFPKYLLNTTESLPSYTTDILIKWVPLLQYTSFQLVAQVMALNESSDIIFLSEELQPLLPRRFINDNIIWFPKRRFSQERWQNYWSERAPHLYCLTCVDHDSDVEMMKRFRPCTSDRDMMTLETDLVVSVIRHMAWKTVLVIFDNKTESQADQIKDQLSEMGVMVWSYTAGNGLTKRNLYPALKKIYDQIGGHGFNALVICSDECSSTLIKEANAFDEYYQNTTALKLWSKWLIVQTTLNTTYLEQGNVDIDNIAVLRDPRYHICFSTDLRKDLVEIVHTIYTDSLRGNCTRSLTDISYLKENVLSVFNISAVTDKPMWSTLLWRTNGRQLAEVHGEYLTVNKLFPNSFFKFNNRKFVVSTHEWPPFAMKQKINNKTVFTGICIDLLNELARSLNFSYELIQPPDLEWGVLKDGNWTGLIGQLSRSEVDLVVASITVTDSRETVMDFSFPYFYDYTGIFLKKPDRGIDKWYTLLAPFKWQVLVCIFCVLIFTTIFLFVIEKVNPFYVVTDKHRHRFQLEGALWYLLGALLNHGGVHVPIPMASRIIVGCWWLFCMVTAATYSGNLIAFLTVSKDRVPFENLQEMAQQNTYKWGIMGGSVTETLFQNSSIDTYQTIWNKLQDFSRTDPAVLDASETVHRKKILEGNYALITDRSVMASWSNYSCNISLLPEKFFSNHYALGLPNNSPYLNIFSNQMIQIYESGLLQIWVRRWWPKYSYCAGGLKTSAEAVDLLSLQSAFYIIAIGVFVSVCVLLSEMIRPRVKCRKKRSDV